MSIANRLQASPLGKQLTAEQCQSLGTLMTEVSVGAGETLFAAGDEADALYIVTHGSFNVVLSSPTQDDLVIAIVGPGGVIGELEIFTGGKRMANVVATERSSCLRLAADVVAQPPRDHAAAIAALVQIIARVLALRLAAVNNKLVAAWNLPEAGAETNGASAPTLHDVLDDVWRW